LTGPREEASTAEKVVLRILARRRRLLLVYLSTFLLLPMGVSALSLDDRGAEAASHAQSEVPVGWTEVDEPSKADLHCANWSPLSWRVESTAQGMPTIIAHDELAPRRDFVPWPFTCPLEGDGRVARRVAYDLGTAWLLGCDLGSYGGGLWLIARDDSSRAALWNARVWDIVLAQGRTWALTEGTESGSGLVLEVVAQENSWAVRRRAEVRGYPVGLVEWEGGVLLVTREGLFALGERSATLLMPLDLDRLFPTSVALSERGDVYVAMRHYLLRLRSTSTGWSRQWLAPAQCPSFRPRLDRPCECVAEQPASLRGP
jgi:hypothetical protein